MHLSVAVKQLAEKYHVSPRAVYGDWSRRGEWAGAFVDLRGSGTLLIDLVTRHEELYSRAFSAYAQADNSSARVGALRLLRELNLDLNDLAVSRDLLERVERLEEAAKKGGESSG